MSGDDEDRWDDAGDCLLDKVNEMLEKDELDVEEMDSEMIAMTEVHEWVHELEGRQQKWLRSRK